MIVDYDDYWGDDVPICGVAQVMFINVHLFTFQKNTTGKQMLSLHTKELRTHPYRMQRNKGIDEGWRFLPSDAFLRNAKQYCIATGCFLLQKTRNHLFAR